MPMFPSETARPIMQYVRDLESKVLVLRAERRVFQISSFVAGVLVGVAIVFLVLRYLQWRGFHG